MTATSEGSDEAISLLLWRFPRQEQVHLGSGQAHLSSARARGKQGAGKSF
jgi:hypothetical protein